MQGKPLNSNTEGIESVLQAQQLLGVWEFRVLNSLYLQVLIPYLRVLLFSYLGCDFGTEDMLD